MQQQQNQPNTQKPNDFYMIIFMGIWVAIIIIQIYYGYVLFKLMAIRRHKRKLLQNSQNEPKK
jgi:predicted membrane protein